MSDFLFVFAVLFGLFVLWVVLGALLNSGRQRKQIISDIRARGAKVRHVGSGVYVKRAESTGSIKMHATSDGVYIESDKGGTVTISVNGIEIEETLQPGEKKFFGTR